MKYLKLKFLLMFFALAMAIPPAWADVLASADFTQGNPVESGNGTWSYYRLNTSSTYVYLPSGGYIRYTDNSLPSTVNMTVETSGYTGSMNVNGGTDHSFTANETYTFEDVAVTDGTVTLNSPSGFSPNIAKLTITTASGGDEPTLTTKTSTIVFGDNGSDASQDLGAQADGLSLLKAYTTEGADLIADFEGSKVYKGITGLKFSTSSVDGNLVITLAPSWKATKITVNAKYYNTNTTSKIKITAGNSQTEFYTLTKDYTGYDLSFSEATDITTIRLDAYNRMYVKSITIEYVDDGAPYITVDPPTGLTINDATGDNKTGTLTATLMNGQGGISAATNPSDKWSWSNNTVTFNGKELGATGDVTFSATDATDVEVDLEYNYTGPLYIIGYVNGGDWSANNMVKMEGPDDDGIYSVTLPITPNGNNNSEISFSKRMGSVWNAWGEIYEYRFVPVSNGPWGLTEGTLGGWHSLDFDPSHVDAQKIVMPAGTYTISIDAKNNKFKIERYETPVPKIYNKVTDESQLIAGKKYILVYENEETPAFCGEIITSSSNHYGKSVTGPAISEGSVNIYGYNDIKELTLSGNNNNWLFLSDEGYLYWKGGNTLDVSDDISDNKSKWTVTPVETGFSLYNNAASDARVIRYNPSSPRFACYAETSSTMKSVFLYVEDGVDPVLPAVAEPVITPNGGNFAASQEVTITCETSGATIRYTTDGTDPTATTGTVYDQPFTLNATTTVKAIAVLGEETSQVVSATFTKTGIETIAAANAQSNNTQFTFIGEAVVTFHRSNHLFVRDNSGSGLIYGVSADGDHKFNNGDVLKPEWKAKYTLYNQNGYTTPEFVDPTGVEFKENNGPAAPEMLGTLATTDVNKYVGFNNVTVVRQDRDNKNYYITVGEKDICLRAAYEELVPSLVVGKTYNVTGVVAVYENNPQLNLISATLIKEDPTLSFGETTAFTVYPNAEFTPPTLNTTPAGLEVTYTSSDEDVAAFVDGELVIGDKIGTTTITATFEGNDEYNRATATYTITVEPKPFLVADEAVELETTVGTPVSETFDVAGENLKGDITLTLNDEKGVFAINPTSIAKGDAEGTITVTYTPTDEAVDNATITIESTDAEKVTVTLTGLATMPVPVEIAAITFNPEPGSYTEPVTVTIGCETEGAVITYSTDGGETWLPNGSKATQTVTVDKDMTLMAKATVGDKVEEATAVYSFEFPVTISTIEPLEGYYQIKNNGNNQFANVQGRKTLTFTDAPDDKAGTVIYVKTDDKGQVQSLRSQAADLQGYADKAMNYVPELVHLVADKLEVEGVGSLFGENGVDAILDKFNEGFDHHLYVEEFGGGYRIYGKTPSMQHVVEFYRENQAKVDAKLPLLETAINNAIQKILEKTNGSGAAILTPFSVDTVWKHMNNPYLIEPVDEASTMAFYHQVLMNKDFVWSFAYETAMIYWNNLKNHPKYETMIKPQLGEYADYIEKIEQVRPNFKYYIAQKDDKPDFISEGNVDVNADRNIWTVVPRDKFTVNVPEANEVKDGYVTTLYTDFGYTLPEGVTAYAVTNVDENGYATTETIGNAVPAQTPVLLKATTAGDKVLTLNPASRGAIEDNLLVGPDYLIGEYQIKTPTVEQLFDLVKGLFGEEIYNNYLKDYEHLMLRYAGLVNNKYFWGLSQEDVAKCIYTNEYDEEYCVVRSLDVKNGEVAFYDNSTVSTNKAFLVTETLDKILLDLPEVPAPTFTPEPGSYTEGKTVTIGCENGDAEIYYSTDGGNTWTKGNTVEVNEDMTLMAKAVLGGVETPATAVYSFEFPVTIPTIEPLEGYYQIKNNGNSKYANVQGRKTLTFTDAPADKAGTVIYVKTDNKGQVQSLRSQAADLQGYADKAMNYVPELVHLVADKLEVEGVGSLFGENGVDAILDKFNEGFDHHLYVEEFGGGYRIYGKTPSMQHVVEFYRENQAKVDAKLPLLETAINNAIQKILEKTNGSGAAILTPFSVDTVWKHMNNPYLIEPVDEASTMAFYHQVLMNKDFVWSFAYETAMIYWNNLKNHPKYETMIKPQLGEYADYIEKIEQVRPNFKYYIAQKDGKPDFISQGNVDVDAARNIWTVVPRTDFTVNIAGEMFGCPLAGIGGYATTNYTDFAYTLPDGVTAYKVTAVDSTGNAKLVALDGIIPAQTPVMLIAKEASDYTLTVTTEAGTADLSGNQLVGPDYLIGQYQIKTPTVEQLFNLVKGLFGEEIYNRYMLDYEHLMLRYAGLVNNKYFWGLSQEDVAKCIYTNEYDEEYCVVRSLDVKDGVVGFYDNSTVSTNKAFLVNTEFDPITLNNLRGDVNHDGLVNIKDVTDLIDFILHDPNNLAACEYCSDVNQNHGVNIDDVTELIDILLANGTSTIVPDDGEGE